MKQLPVALFSWNDLLLNDLNLAFAAEIVVRTLVMFVFVLVLLRSSGKKGVRQLSIFEVAIIISLGSAAGDPMLNKESALIPSLLVFAVILGLYRLLTYFSAKNMKVEELLEGVPMYVIEDGVFTLEEEGDSNFAKDEFFAEMRAVNIEHVGQVRTALLETNGQVSFCYYPDAEVKPGLPVYPKLYNTRSKEIQSRGLYACTYCANVTELSQSAPCSRCQKEEWVASLATTRVT
jgi:uncharacterized membrane protein YcaP (DUF421 family)